MAAGAVSLKNLSKYEEVRKLEKELIRLYIYGTEIIPNVTCVILKVSFSLKNISF